MGKIKIVHYSDEPFEDRKQAGKLLADSLKDLSGKDTVVLGIPRGGIVIAYEIARLLNSELDIVLSRKLGAPGNPELAIGAVSEEGKVFINQDLAASVNAGDTYIEAEKARQSAEIRNRVKLFRRAKAKAALKGKTAIVTDDGVATGATMQAALWLASRESPKKLICAVPVASESSVKPLAEYADEVIVLRAPRIFYAIGQFYRDFAQTSDEDVLKILKETAHS